MSIPMSIVPMSIVPMILVASTVSAPAPITPALAVSISIPSDGSEQRLEYRRPDDHFHVIVSNRSDIVQNVWQEWCSWGHANLSFEFENAAGKTWTAKKRPGLWTRNFPSAWAIAPGDQLVLDVHWGDEAAWEGFPPFGTERETFRVRAVFEIAEDGDTSLYKVWTGRVVSDTRDVLLSKWRLDAK